MLFRSRGTIFPRVYCGGIAKAEHSLQSRCPKAVWKPGKLVNSGAAAWAKSVLGA